MDRWVSARLASLLRHGLRAAGLVLLLAFSSGAAAQDRAPASAPTTTEDTALPKQPVSVVPASSDDDIAGRLERILRSTEWFAAPRVSAREGVVFLEGGAASQDQRRWAGALAQNTEGVVAVVNRIEVESDVQSTFDRAARDVVNFYRETVRAWPLLALILVILLASWLVARGLAMLGRRFFARRVSSPLLLSILVQAVAVPSYLLGIYLVLRVAGLTQLALTVLGGTGLLGIVLGFAFRDIAENFLASLLLSARNPFRSGDLIEVAGQTGIVQTLNTRSTVLLTLDGNHVQIPNAAVYKSTIKNYSSTPTRRAEFMVGIGYDCSTATAQGLIAQVVKGHPAVLDAPEPVVLVDALGDATVNLRVQYWFDSATYSPAKINSALLRLAKNALRKGGFKLPDPAREIIFPKGVPVIGMEGLRMAGETGRADRSAADAAQADLVEDSEDATEGEGDLGNETAAVREQSKGAVPEAGENLLKG